MWGSFTHIPPREKSGTTQLVTVKYLPPHHRFVFFVTSVTFCSICRPSTSWRCPWRCHRIQNWFSSRWTAKWLLAPQRRVKRRGYISVCSPNIPETQSCLVFLFRAGFLSFRETCLNTEKLKAIFIPVSPSSYRVKPSIRRYPWKRSLFTQDDKLASSYSAIQEEERFRVTTAKERIVIKERIHTATEQNSVFVTLKLRGVKERGTIQTSTHRGI